MTIYFQHVGQRGGASHFPLTIGTKDAGLRNFLLADIEQYLSNETDQSRQQLKTVLGSITGFQIWGAPSGARSILKDIVPCDWLLLLESDRPGGQFYYGGKVLFRLPRENFELSNHLWGDASFPIIILLDGKLTNFEWDKFRENMAYGAKWRLQGRTYKVTSERLAQSSYLSEVDIINAVLGETTSDTNDEVFSALLDQVELTYASMEGRKRLREHLVRERDSNLIRRFKRSLKSFECLICNFDFEKVYGDLGRSFIEGHHVEPIGLRDGDEITDIRSLIPVCSNCHRMLHRRIPPYLPDELSNLMIHRFEEKEE